MNNQEIKLSQYADDTTFILDGTKESLTATFHLLPALELIIKKLKHCGSVLV